MYGIEEAADGIKDWSTRPAAEALARRSAAFGTLKPASRTLLSDMIGIVQAGWRTQLTTHAGSLMTTLGGESRASPSLNPERLLDYAGREGDDFMDGRLRFEALSTFDLAVFLMAIEDEPAGSRYVVGEDVSEITELLFAKALSGEKKERQVRVVHDPSNFWRVSRVDFDGSGEPSDAVAVHEMVFRSSGDGVSAMHEPGPKDLYSAGLKMLRRRRSGHAHWKGIRDRRGFRLTVPQEEDIPRTVAMLERFAESVGARLFPAKDKVEDPTGKMNADNVHSSPDFHAKKYLLTWCGRIFEVQVQTVRDYYSAIYSLGEENHNLYDHRKFAEDAELLRPRLIYQIDWRTETRAPDGRLYVETLDNIRRRVARATNRY